MELTPRKVPPPCYACGSTADVPGSRWAIRSRRAEPAAGYLLRLCSSCVQKGVRLACR